MTNTLDRRAMEHQLKKDKNSFTARYNITDLLYYEDYASFFKKIKQ